MVVQRVQVIAPEFLIGVVSEDVFARLAIVPFGRHPDDPLDVLGEVGETQIGIHLPQPVPGCIRKVSEALLATPMLGFGALQIRDVAAQPDDIAEARAPLFDAKPPPVGKALLDRPARVLMQRNPVPDPFFFAADRVCELAPFDPGPQHVLEVFAEAQEFSVHRVHVAVALVEVDQPILPVVDAKPVGNGLQRVNQPIRLKICQSVCPQRPLQSDLRRLWHVFRMTNQGDYSLA